ncbi:MAG: DUF2892 domain-containing protein [Hyphomonadaceae bacterium]|nr:DUF2892 domain-containing protein [Hyphomonadaceae bacterium]
MKPNVGTADRLIRLLIGVLAITAVFIGPFAVPGWERTALAIVGAIMVATAAVKFCPLYQIFGWRTCPAK